MEEKKYSQDWYNNYLNDPNFILTVELIDELKKYDEYFNKHFKNTVMPIANYIVSNDNPLAYPTGIETYPLAITTTSTINTDSFQGYWNSASF